jgi:hypothetical protein
MRRLLAILTAAALALGVSGAAAANGETHRNSFKANLSGYQEVPAISSTASGKVTLTINPAETQIAYTLTYSALQGGGALAAHIHFAQRSVNGAVVAFLCGGGGKAACPVGGGTISGTIVAADVLAVPAQGIAAGDLGAVLRAMRNGVTYANVHSVGFPGGEIRCQIPGRKGGH